MVINGISKYFRIQTKIPYRPRNHRISSPVGFFLVVACCFLALVTKAEEPANNEIHEIKRNFIADGLEDDRIQCRAGSSGIDPDDLERVSGLLKIGGMGPHIHFYCRDNSVPKRYVIYTTMLVVGGWAGSYYIVDAEDSVPVVRKSAPFAGGLPQEIAYDKAGTPFLIIANNGGHMGIMWESFVQSNLISGEILPLVSASTGGAGCGQEWGERLPDQSRIDSIATQLREDNLRDLVFEISRWSCGKDKNLRVEKIRFAPTDRGFHQTN